MARPESKRKDLEEMKGDLNQQLKDNLIIKVKEPNRVGGQQTQRRSTAISVKCEELDIEISVGYHRSQIDNKQLAVALIELAIDDILN